MGNAADCKVCSNRGSYYGCKSCGRVNTQDGNKRDLRWAEKDR